ncbi:MAG: hypothetical protein EKK55_07045 [Rhodocyclaceae bacterium]|nr:MAG: hypothetical protein EKK55_07045 [Rhodocyclaceae bacterium]
MAALDWMIRTDRNRIEGFLARGTAARERGEDALAERLYTIAAALDCIASATRVHGQGAEHYIAAQIADWRTQGFPGSPSMHLALFLLRRERAGARAVLDAAARLAP